MLNRHAKPILTIPKRCVKCGGLNIPDNSYAYGERVDGFRCVACGLTSESTIFLDAIKKRVVEINE